MPHENKLQIMSSGKCKLIQQDTTTHLIEQPKSRILTTSNAQAMRQFLIKPNTLLIV